MCRNSAGATCTVCRATAYTKAILTFSWLSRGYYFGLPFGFVFCKRGGSVVVPTRSSRRH